MNLFIIFAFILSTIILAIVLEKIINCPILVGLAFFAIFLIVAAILDDTTLIIFAIILGIIAFISALLYCLFIKSELVNVKDCLGESCNNYNNDTNFLTNETLTIVNSNGDVVAKINSNSRKNSGIYGKY